MNHPLREYVAAKRNDKLAKAKTDDAKAEIELAYLFEQWTQSAADRAGQISVASHLGPISHPDAKIAPFVAEPSASVDGYLRAGNVNVPWDAFGNAAALDTLGFVKTVLADGRTTLEHFHEGTQMVRDLFDFADDDLYESIRQRFLQMFENTKPYPVTSSEIKQVYFPLPDGDYHLLSIVSSSGLMRENRLRLQAMESSDEAKASRKLHREEQKKTPSAKSSSDTEASGFYRNIPGRASIKLGGANAQNVSSFNAECRGVWPLFTSMRTTDARYQRVPRRDYFEFGLRWDDSCRKTFASLHKIFLLPDWKSNHDLRELRKRRLEELWLWVCSTAFEYQSLPGGWSDDPSNRLPLHQKLWLDSGRREAAPKDHAWRDPIASDFAAWTLKSYKRMGWGKQEPVSLETVERTQFRIEVADLPMTAKEWQTWEN
jgi:CRISPR-associated protein Csy1